MNKTINGTFGNHDQARNTWDDLIATGIPRDNLFIDEENHLIKVMVPSETEREIEEIFQRHGIRQVH